MTTPTRGSAGLPVLRGDRVLLRPATAGDVPGLVALLAAPSVRRWWGDDYDAAKVAGDLEELTTWVIEVGGVVAGWLHVSEEPDEDYRCVGFDIAVGEAHQGAGIGQEAMRLAMAHFADAGHHRFTIDPRADNARAIRSYERLGFRPIGIARRAERGSDGVWRDCLLMDALAGELPWR